MQLSDLSTSAQNYLKVIWAETEWKKDPVTLSVIAEKLNLRLSTISEGVRKLNKQGCVSHTPYGAVELTEEGKNLALQMIRRHRLIETFLVQVLGYSWDEVHDEAENVEHSVSDLLIERIDKMLGFPTRDPHGDPIPTVDGKCFIPDAKQLSSLADTVSVTVERITDDDPELLQFFAENRINVDVTLHIEKHNSADGSFLVRVADAENTLGVSAAAAEALYVSKAAAH